MPGLPRQPGAKSMKDNVHPSYNDVVFHDVTSDFKILTRSTMSSKETVKWEAVSYTHLTLPTIILV